MAEITIRVCDICRSHHATQDIEQCVFCSRDTCNNHRQFTHFVVGFSIYVCTQCNDILVHHRSEFLDLLKPSNDTVMEKLKLFLTEARLKAETKPKPAPSPAASAIKEMLGATLPSEGILAHRYKNVFKNDK